MTPNRCTYSHTLAVVRSKKKKPQLTVLKTLTRVKNQHNIFDWDIFKRTTIIMDYYYYRPSTCSFVDVFNTMFFRFLFWKLNSKRRPTRILRTCRRPIFVVKTRTSRSYSEKSQNKYSCPKFKETLYDIIGEYWCHCKRSLITTRSRRY